MTRGYTFRARKPKEIIVPVTPYTAEQVKELADSFYAETVNCGALAAEIYLSMTPLDLRDLLTAELYEASSSPVSLEIRRRMRAYCKERAEKVAGELVLGD